MPSPVTLIDEFIEDQVAAGNSDSYVVDEWVHGLCASFAVVRAGSGTSATGTSAT
jgi:hypothetical protein